MEHNAAGQEDADGETDEHDEVDGAPVPSVSQDAKYRHADGEFDQGDANSVENAAKPEMLYSENQFDLSSRRKGRGVNEPSSQCGIDWDQCRRCGGPSQRWCHKWSLRTLRLVSSTQR